MAGYDKTEAPDGTVRYRLNNRFIAKTKVPVDIIELLETEKTVGETAPTTTENFKPCLFCGQHGKYTRSVNMQTVVLCEEHYYSETIGKIVQHLREKENA